MKKFFEAWKIARRRVILILALILGFAFMVSSCATLGIGGKAEEPAPPKTEAPPPPKPEALPVKPEITPPPAPPSPPPPVKEAQPPAVQPPVTLPPASPKEKEEVKPSAPPAAVYVITLKNSNVRAEPDLKSKIITTLKKGTKVEKIGQSGDWVHVKLPTGKTGWIFHELVREEE